MTGLDLVQRWREDADRLRQWGANSQADVLERAAGQLEAELRAADEQLLTLDEAAQASGYSADHIGRMLRKGALPNRGCKHRPRVRNGDLPRKRIGEGQGRAGGGENGYNTDRLFRDIANSKFGGD